MSEEDGIKLGGEHKKAFGSFKAMFEKGAQESSGKSTFSPEGHYHAQKVSTPLPPPPVRTSALPSGCLLLLGLLDPSSALIASRLPEMGSVFTSVGVW